MRSETVNLGLNVKIEWRPKFSKDLEIKLLSERYLKLFQLLDKVGVY